MQVKKKFPLANGATYPAVGQSGTLCYAEFNMDGVLVSPIKTKHWQTAFLIPSKVTRGAAGGDTGKCSKTLGGWAAGDGIGTKEVYVGSYRSREACVCAVKMKHPLASGATYSGPLTQHHKCYAEYGMTGRKVKGGAWQSVYIGKVCGTALPRALIPLLTVQHLAPWATSRARPLAPRARGCLGTASARAKSSWAR